MFDFGTSIINEDESTVEKVPFLYNNLLTFNPQVNTVNTYLTTLSFFDKTDKEVNRLNYETTITYLPTEKGYLCEVIKKDIFINGKEPSLLMEQIANEFNKVLYPLNLSIKHTGKIIAVENIEDIQKRWQKEKKRFNQKYKGIVIGKIIKQFDNAVGNSARLTALLHNDIFYQVFFHNNYQTYKTDYQFSNTMLLSVEGSTVPISFKGLNTITPKTTQNQTIAVNFEGNCELDKNHELSRRIQSNQKNSGDLVVSYDLNKETRLPEMIQMVASFFDEKETHLKTIEVFIAKEATKKAPVVLLEEGVENVPTPKKKKGFFSIFKSKTK
ncbi:hypothetical protein [Aquimarina agarivorans]|uniref:hypothetical protein n=1 Tax=Aquimarina agarivorans TaxID=980584 RepID=UPI000248E8D1|nr:hypothetical protein [Aquimarina agarivorans]